MDTKLVIDDNDGYNWMLKHALSEYTQEELAQELIEYKHATMSEPQIRIGGEYGEHLITIGLETPEEFLEKYSDILTAAGMKKENEVAKEEEKTEVKEETTDKKVIVKPLSKLISDYTMEELASLVMSDKGEDEYGVQIKGTVYDSKNCNSEEDFINKYRDEFLKLGIKSVTPVVEEKKEEIDVEKIQKEREERIKPIFASQDGNRAKYIFKLPRGNKYVGEEEELKLRVAQKEAAYINAFNRNESVDFENPKATLDWFDTIVPYINAHALTLGNYSNMYILAFMKERGYTSEINDINYSDENRIKIADKLSELEKYNFVVSDYPNLSPDLKCLNTHETLVASVDIENKFLNGQIEDYENGIIKIDEKVEQSRKETKDSIERSMGSKEKLEGEQLARETRFAQLKEKYANSIERIKARIAYLKSEYHLVEEIKEEIEVEEPKKEGVLVKLKNALNEVNEQLEKEKQVEVNEEVSLDFTYPTDDSIKEFVPIRSIRKISKELYEKETCKKYREALKDAISKLNEHKTAVITGALLAVTVALDVVTGPIGKEEVKEDTNTVIESSDDATIDVITDANLTALAAGIIQNTSGFKEVNNGAIAEEPEVVVEKEMSLDEKSNSILNDVNNGQTEVYTSSDRAINNESGLSSDKLYMDSFKDANLGNYYKLDDGKVSEVSKEEAEDIYNHGGELAQSIENNGEVIGYVNVEKEKSM